VSRHKLERKRKNSPDVIALCGLVAHIMLELYELLNALPLPDFSLKYKILIEKFYTCNNKSIATNN